MPLSIVAGTLAALLLVTDTRLWEAAILATILAPTDASLGAAVVKSKLVPSRIRGALEVESGLNDGLSMPFLVQFMGWFGPRGLAPVVLGMIYLEEVTGIGANSNIVLAMAATVLLRVLAHRVSANPAIKLYARQVADLKPDAPEHA